MKTSSPMLPLFFGLLLAVATGVAFAGWLDKGAAMFLALAEAGLSWCL